MKSPFLWAVFFKFELVSRVPTPYVILRTILLSSFCVSFGFISAFHKLGLVQWFVEDDVVLQRAFQFAHLGGIAD